MEKYARQALAEGIKSADDIQVSKDSELYRVLNLHYNRNNHIEVWNEVSQFCFFCPQFRFFTKTRCSRFIGAWFIPWCGWRIIEGILQSHPSQPGPGALMEESHLQGH